MTDNPRKTKGRPRKAKIIQGYPRTELFSPKGRPGKPEEVLLAVEEYEAVRLSDLEGFDQLVAARSMGISQQSFSRLVRKARRSIADAIVNAKVIKIEGGDFISRRSIDISDKLRGKTRSAVLQQTIQGKA